MRKPLSRAAAAAGLIASQSLPAAADSWRIPIPSAISPDTRRGVMWLEAEGGFRWRPQPTFNYGSIVGSGQPAYKFSQNVSGGFGDVTVGYALGRGRPLFALRDQDPDQYASSDLAQAATPTPSATCNCQLTASFTFANGTASTPKSVTTTHQLPSIGPFVGSEPDTIYSATRATLKTESKSAEFGLGFETITPIGGPPFLASASDDQLAQAGAPRRPRLVFANRVALFGETHRITNKLRLAENLTADPQFTVDERVTTSVIGAGYALSARGWVTERFSVHGGALLAFTIVRMHLQGSECQDNFVDTAGCQPFATATVTRTAVRAGARIGLQLGADYEIGGVIIGLTGRMDIDTAVPKITNPTSLGPDGLGERARLGTATKVGGVIMGRIAVPFSLF